MSPAGCARLANAFVVAYALDAGVSLCDEILRAVTGFGLLSPLRNGLALLVVTGALLCLPAIALTPRLPTGLLLMLALSALWLTSGGAPLPLWLGTPAALGAGICGLQAAFAAGALLWIRRASGGRRWLFTPGMLAGPAFSWRHSARFFALVVFGIAPAGLVYLAVSTATWVHASTGGFLSFDLAGVTLADRCYVRDDREIRLVGMMHIGEGEAYRELFSSFLGEDTIVLTEGVSDDRGLFAEELSYGRVARALGLEAQGSVESQLEEVQIPDAPELPVVRRADVDFSDFAPETVEWLRWAARVWDSDEPLRAVAELARRASQTPDTWRVVKRDILARRNEYLLREISRATEEYERVVVPWGALHLPFIEESILGWGFDERDRSRRRLISWRTVATAVLGSGRQVADRRSVVAERSWSDRGQP